MKIECDPSLPIGERADDIVDLLRQHQVVVIAGETGSGKTTQLPKLAMLAGKNRIAHTQPRRIAARSVASRIAKECEVELGDEVGYAVRFDDKSTVDTQIRLVTDGLLLAELAHDPDLLRYDTVIIDEAHERSLAIDFLMGYLVRLTERRPDLSVIITSATIDVQRFADLFRTPDREVPVMEVSGRTYPVEIRYRPLAESDAADLPEAVAGAIAELPRDGDVLVFASGEREIRDIAEHLEGRWGQTMEILPLHGRLPAHEQQRIFSPGSRRRVIIATNVAETSLTVPRIRYVIDPGFARISRFSTRLKVQRLPIEPISQASAAQRAGRCGRIAEGICIRLYSEEDHDGRPEFTDPEIHRTNLASVILQMAQLQLGPVEEFGFLDAPDSRAIASGRALLTELGALDREQLTRAGRLMANLPVDPRMARMLLAADNEGCLADVLVIVAAMSIQDPRERPMENREAADTMHRRFRSPISDFLSYLTLWNYLLEQRQALSHTKFRKMCHAEHLHYLRVREWQDVHAQLRRTVREMRLKPGTLGADQAAIHRALLTGLLGHVAVRTGDGREFLGARGASLMIWPGSDLAKKPPRWIMAGELMETSRLWARTVAAIEPAWVEEVADHLLKRQYSEPRWSAKRGAAVATLRATLYGLPVVTGRTVPLSRVDPDLSRELFIRHALVGGQWRTHHQFVRHNAAMLAEMADLEERTRRRDLQVHDDTLIEFFEARIPAHIVSVRHFDRWWRTARVKDPHFLDFNRELFVTDVGNVDEEFPQTWTSQSSAYDLDYRFEPGSARDGVEVSLTIEDLLSADPEEFRWHVPGHRRELITALIRSLPRPQRRHFAPAPAHADAILPELSDNAGPLLPQLARLLSRTHPVRPEDFDEEALPAHLRIQFVIRDGENEKARGYDLEALRRELAPAIEGTVRQTFSELEKDGITHWDWEELPQTVDDGSIQGYVTLVDEGASVATRVVLTAEEQEFGMIRGTTRLIALSVANPAARLAKGLPLNDALALTSLGYRDVQALVTDAWLAAIDDLVVKHQGPAWTQDQFDSLRERVRTEMVPHTEALLTRVIAAARLLSRLNLGTDEASEDVRIQLSWLIHDGFVRDMGVAWLPRLAVYLQAAQRRLSSSKNLESVYALEARFHDMTAELSRLRAGATDVQHARWSLEELRVSMVAQELRTAFSVSTKKVAATLDELAATLDSQLSRRPANR